MTEHIINILEEVFNVLIWTQVKVAQAIATTSDNVTDLPNTQAMAATLNDIKELPVKVFVTFHSSAMQADGEIRCKALSLSQIQVQKMIAILKKTEKAFSMLAQTYVHQDTQAMGVILVNVKELSNSYVLVNNLPSFKFGDTIVQVEDDNVLVVNSE